MRRAATLAQLRAAMQSAIGPHGGREPMGLALEAERAVLSSPAIEGQRQHGAEGKKEASPKGSQVTGSDAE